MGLRQTGASCLPSRRPDGTAVIGWSSGQRSEGDDPRGAEPPPQGDEIGPSHSVASRGSLKSVWTHAADCRVHIWASAQQAAANPPVALVHGVVSSRYLHPTAQHLARTHRVAAVDLPGFGPGTTRQRVLNIEELGEAAGAALAAIGVDGAVVVGHSIGAQVAVELACRVPTAVRGLVLVGPTGDPALRSALKLWGGWMATAPREPLSFNALTVRELLSVGPRRMLATARAAVDDPFVTKLRAVDVPALVVRGEHDRVAPAAWAERVRATLGAPLATIGGVAHTVVFSAPHQLASLIAGFGAGVAARAEWAE